MLKLNRESCAVGYATPWVSSMASDEQTRTMPACYSACNKISAARRVYKNRSVVLKVVPVTPVIFFTCLDWAVFYSQSTDGRATGAGKEAF
ncbi:hypothetical protein [Pseudomonas sp. Root329]|jgi:hypothetical protein|uniref:hypothetical protein n=1 Tax=Pseudomonas sp. Root329 TaxID=1736515 RepID=UPI0012E3F435|nr:hypothetical protein [Pseudomonas sp. Root329]